MPWDRRKYPADWEAIVLRIRERSGGQCECSGVCGRAACQGRRCEARNGQPHPRTGSKVILTTAHLDHDVTRNTDDNLAALCQSCHLHLDRHQHASNAAATRVRRREEGGQGRLNLDGEVRS
jgi:hypothetical protein